MIPAFMPTGYQSSVQMNTGQNPNPPTTQPQEQNEEKKLQALQAQAQQWQQHKQWQVWMNAQSQSVASAVSGAPQSVTPSPYTVVASSATQPSKDISADLAAVIKEEEDFEKQYREWENQFEQWKVQNKDHPNKDQFRQYEEQWQTWKASMEDKRREILSRKTVLQQTAAMAASSAQPLYTATAPASIPYSTPGGAQVSNQVPVFPPGAAGMNIYANSAPGMLNNQPLGFPQMNSNSYLQNQQPSQRPMMPFHPGMPGVQGMVTGTTFPPQGMGFSPFPNASQPNPSQVQANPSVQSYANPGMNQPPMNSMVPNPMNMQSYASFVPDNNQLRMPVQMMNQQGGMMPSSQGQGMRPSMNPNAYPSLLSNSNQSSLSASSYDDSKQKDKKSRWGEDSQNEQSGHKSSSNNSNQPLYNNTQPDFSMSPSFPYQQQNMNFNMPAGMMLPPNHGSDFPNDKMMPSPQQRPPFLNQSQMNRFPPRDAPGPFPSFPPGSNGNNRMPMGKDMRPMMDPRQQGYSPNNMNMSPQMRPHGSQMMLPRNNRPMNFEMGNFRRSPSEYGSPQRGGRYDGSGRRDYGDKQRKSGYGDRGDYSYSSRRRYNDSNPNDSYRSQGSERSHDKDRSFRRSGGDRSYDRENRENREGRENRDNREKEREKAVEDNNDTSHNSRNAEAASEKNAKAEEVAPVSLLPPEETAEIERELEENSFEKSKEEENFSPQDFQRNQQRMPFNPQLPPNTMRMMMNNKKARFEGGPMPPFDPRMRMMHPNFMQQQRMMMQQRFNMNRMAQMRMMQMRMMGGKPQRGGMGPGPKDRRLGRRKFF